MGTEFDWPSHNISCNAWEHAVKLKMCYKILFTQPQYILTQGSTERDKYKNRPLGCKQKYFNYIGTFWLDALDSCIATNGNPMINSD